MNKFYNIEQHIEKIHKTHWEKYIPESMHKWAIHCERLEHLWVLEGDLREMATNDSSFKGWEKTSWGMDLLNEIEKLINQWESYSQKLSHKELDTFLEMFEDAQYKSIELYDLSQIK